MSRIVRYFGLLLIVGSVFTGGRQAYADEMNWTFVNTINRTISIQLYSQTRRGHLWPDPNVSWTLPADGKEYTERISCDAGEKICYGAWIDGSPGSGGWGVRYNNTASCPNCCGTCGAGNLEPFRLEN